MAGGNNLINTRAGVASITLAMGGLAIGLMGLLPNSATVILLDKGSSFFPYPFTIQNLMWLVMFIGLGECYVRHQAIHEDRKHLNNDYLDLARPTLSNQDLPHLLARLQPLAQGKAFLPRLIYRAAQILMASGSTDSATTNLNSNYDLYAHTIDVRYTTLRYITWLIPTLGFLGTCIGIAIALNYAAAADVQDPALLSHLSANLGVAFYTTFLALLQSAVLVFIMNILQAREEIGLNASMQYCLDNLIGRYTAPRP